MAEPSIKGTIFKSVVEDLRRERDGGRVKAEELEGMLEARDLEILDSKIHDAMWYPIPTYARMLEALCRIAAGGRSVYYAERGAANAQRLLDAGLYSQLDLLGSWDDARGAPGDELERRVRGYEAQLRRVVSLAGAIYNVGRWEVTRDAEAEDRTAIDIYESSDYSDGMRLAIEGFFNQCARHVKGRTPISRLFRSERVAPDHIRIRMTMNHEELLGRL